MKGRMLFRISYFIPIAVLSRTFCLSKSPDDRAVSWGYRVRIRLLCVPFPQPGGPTSITLAALRSLVIVLAAAVELILKNS